MDKIDKKDNGRPPFARTIAIIALICLAGFIALLLIMERLQQTEDTNNSFVSSHDRTVIEKAFIIIEHSHPIDVEKVKLQLTELEGKNRREIQLDFDDYLQQRMVYELALRINTDSEEDKANLDKIRENYSKAKSKLHSKYKDL